MKKGRISPHLILKHSHTAHIVKVVHMVHAVHLAVGFGCHGIGGVKALAPHIAAVVKGSDCLSGLLHGPFVKLTVHLILHMVMMEIKISTAAVVVEGTLPLRSTKLPLPDRDRNKEGGCQKDAVGHGEEAEQHLCKSRDPVDEIYEVFHDIILLKNIGKVCVKVLL